MRYPGGVDASPDEIRTLERLGLAAWPGLTERRLDGWLLRFGGGVSGRANSVSPLAPGRSLLSARLAAVEWAYRAHGLPPRYRLCPVVEPPELPGLLRARGYSERTTTAVETCPLDALPAPRAPGIDVADLDTWLALRVALLGQPLARRGTLRGLLARVPGPAPMIVLRHDGRPVAMGRAVVQGRWVGLFELLTRADRRNEGLGRQLVSCLADRARALGATRAYLQVEADNAPARALYRRLGFAPRYVYRYSERLD